MPERLFYFIKVCKFRCLRLCSDGHTSTPIHVPLALKGGDIYHVTLNFSPMLGTQPLLRAMPEHSFVFHKSFNYLMSDTVAVLWSSWVLHVLLHVNIKWHPALPVIPFWPFFICEYSQELLNPQGTQVSCDVQEPGWCPVNICGVDTRKNKWWWEAVCLLWGSVLSSLKWEGGLAWWGLSMWCADSLHDTEVWFLLGRLCPKAPLSWRCCLCPPLTSFW